MNKEELRAFIGKYILLEFTLYAKKHKCTSYFRLFGRILEVEDKNVLFRCNYNHEFIVPNNRVRSVSLEGERRTDEQYKEMIEKERIALESKILRIEAQKKKAEGELITLNHENQIN